MARAVRSWKAIADRLCIEDAIVEQDDFHVSIIEHIENVEGAPELTSDS